MRYILAALLGALMSLPGAAQADLPRGSYEFADLPIGRLEVVGERGDRRLLWNGAPTGVENWMVEINGVYTEPGSQYYFVLLNSHHGGNGCFGSQMMMRIGPDGVRRTEIFGTCGAILDLRLSGGVFRMDQRDARLYVAHITFSYDGVSLTEQEVAAPAPVDTGLAGGGDVTRWLGTHPTEALNDPAEQGRFLRIMDMATLDELRRHVSVANEVEQRGNWVFGAGCFPHVCNSSAGFWGLNVLTGAPVAMMFDNSAPSGIFGAPADLADPVVRAYMSERSPW